MLPVGQNIADAPHLAVGQAHLDAVRVSGRVGQDVLDDARCALARALVRLEDDLNTEAGLDFTAILA